MASNWVRLGLVVIGATMVSACGGGGGESPPAPPPVPPVVLEGRLLDSAVAGVTYQSLATDGTPTESGVTDAAGTFKYRAGERVRFAVGSVVLPVVTAQEVVTPKTLAATSALDAPLLNNILTLLQSLDSDGNPSNGITINNAARAALTGQTAAALQTALEEDTPTAFAARAELATAVAASGPGAVVVDPVQARRHFAQTLADSGDASPVVTEVLAVTWEGIDWIPAGSGNFYPEQLARIRVKGQSLPDNLAVAGTGACTQYVRDADKSNSTQAEFTCTPTAAGSLSLEVKASGQTLARLADEARPRQPLVALSPVTWEANATAARLFTDYMQGVPIRIRARHVMADEPLQLSGQGVCTNFVRDAGKSSASVSEFTCTPSSAGALTITATATGQSRATLAATVAALPIVRFNVTVPAQAQANPPTLAKSGSFDIMLAPGNAPITVINFLRHVEEGYYPGTVFHRVYPGFMIQAGGLTYGQSGYVNKSAIFSPIALERTTVTGLSNIQFSVAMARTSAVNSATSQFFINVADNSATLDANGARAVDPGNGYAVFGGLTAETEADEVQIIELLNAILLVPKSPSGEGTQPLNPPVITGATRIR